MYKTIIFSLGLLLFTNCASTNSSTFTNKVQNSVQEKTKNRLLQKAGLGTLVKPQKTTTERLIDVAKGKNTLENVAVDIAVDSTANNLLDKALR